MQPKDARALLPLYVIIYNWTWEPSPPLLHPYWLICISPHMQYLTWRKLLKQLFRCWYFICGFACAVWNKRERKVLSSDSTCMRFTITTWSWGSLRLGLVSFSWFLFQSLTHLEFSFSSCSLTFQLQSWYPYQSAIQMLESLYS